jgi:hypothetical protein
VLAQEKTRPKMSKKKNLKVQVFPSSHQKSDDPIPSRKIHVEACAVAEEKEATHTHKSLLSKTDARLTLARTSSSTSTLAPFARQSSTLVKSPFSAAGTSLAVASAYLEHKMGVYEMSASPVTAQLLWEEMKDSTHRNSNRNRCCDYFAHPSACLWRRAMRCDVQRLKARHCHSEEIQDVAGAIIG